ncbi:MULTISPECIES: RNA ligase family protein [unclassified Bacillus (in: firmicutes)]|uniref:ATP-dependent DNA ligase n=2 Tax=Bacillus TaxID=1386 RepID=UPI001BEC6A0E|nr:MULTISPECIES: RNA ligase family protein [unclassified Bacillus (in: firmicutes)]MBT2618654.1 DNA polymerase LigD [Bacillus sp. ISL-78]MBT2719204.1 DNA polymerase LigD [Bacillus sp. ISL-57]
MLNTPIKPMLLQPATEIPKSNKYIHQLKLDGHRALFHYDRGNIKIFTRHLNEVTYKYIELQGIKLPVTTCILDGEMICFDGKENPPKPCFDSLMVRFQMSNQEKIKEIKDLLPVHFSSFDILYLNGESLINKPLSERLDTLSTIVENTPFISTCPTYSDGDELYNRVEDLGLEGVVSKNLSRPYTLDSRPQDVFLKIKNYQYDSVKIGAIRKKKFGWLMLDQDNQYKGILEFVPPKERKAFYEISKQLITNEDENYFYLDPLIKCEVKFQCLSKKGLMRSASFQKFII